MARTKHLNKPFSQFDPLTAKLFALTRGFYQEAWELIKKKPGKKTGRAASWRELEDRWDKKRRIMPYTGIPGRRAGYNSTANSGSEQWDYDWNNHVCKGRGSETGMNP
jgi:hypothetical protein